MINNDLTAKLLDKWAGIIPFPENAPKDTQKIVAVLLENQSRHFDEIGVLKGTTPESCFMTNHFGAYYKKRLLEGLACAAFKTDLWDIVATQPMTQPIGMLFWYQQTIKGPKEVSENSTTIPTVCLSIESDTAAAHNRSLRRPFHPAEDKFGRDGQTDMINVGFTKIFTQLRREVLCDLLTASESCSITASENQLLGAVQHQATKIHRKTMRGPGNRIACHPQHLDALELMNDKFKIFSDWEFPKDKVLVFYNGPSILDRPLIYAPYKLQFSGSDSKNLWTSFRSAKKFVHQDAVALVKIDEFCY